MSDQPTIVQRYDGDGMTEANEGAFVLYDAYLAQGEELAAECIRYGKLAQLCRQQGEDMVDVLEQRDQLKAENLALRSSMETEYIERQAKHIQELVQENLALKSSTYRADKQDGE